jgi:hypothetical protein
MKCVDTRNPVPGFTRRIYFCVSCDKKFHSSEVLDGSGGEGKEVAMVSAMDAERGADDDFEDDDFEDDAVEEYDSWEDEDEWEDEDDWDAEDEYDDWGDDD